MKKKLLISEDLSLPPDFVVERIAFFGRTENTDGVGEQIFYVGPFNHLDARGILPRHEGTPISRPQLEHQTLAEIEREHILRIFRECYGNRERAAVTLGISSRTLYRKLREYDAQKNPEPASTED
jgi:DNA-binding NtrC family response regulator